MIRKLAPFAVAGAILLFAAPTVAQPAQLDELHDALNLTPAEETAWQTFRVAVSPDPNIAARRRATQQLLPTVPTPQRIALIDAQMQADLDTMRRYGAAVKAFYATLDPVRKRVFDAQTAPKAGAEPFIRPPTR